MRAVETGRYLVRAANTGISGVVDPYGRVVGSRRRCSSGPSVGEVRLLDGTTLYVRIGDAVAWACLVVAVGLWRPERQRGRRRSRVRLAARRRGDPSAVHRS